jgi:hypothetical protein
MQHVAFFLSVFPSEYPIISIGSGPGTAEWKLKHHFGVCHAEWITVDPDPESYKSYPKNREKCMPPMFDTVVSLVTQRPEVVSRCVVFLPWPYPSHYSEYQVDTPYDLEAIRLLLPVGVVLVFETIGGAGTDELHDWLDTMDESDQRLNPEYVLQGRVVNTTYHPTVKYISPKKKCTWYGSNTFGRLSHRLLLLLREDMDFPGVRELPDHLEWNAHLRDVGVCSMM